MVKFLSSQRCFVLDILNVTFLLIMTLKGCSMSSVVTSLETSSPTTDSLHGFRRHVNVINLNSVSNLTDTSPWQTAQASDCSDHQQTSVAGSASLGNMAACPWVTLTDTDPDRIPRELHYVRCLCQYSQVDTEDTLARCEETRVLVPYLTCNTSPGHADPPTCSLHVKSVAVACHVAYHIQGTIVQR